MNPRPKYEWAGIRCDHRVPAEQRCIMDDADGRCTCEIMSMSQGLRQIRKWAKAAGWSRTPDGGDDCGNHMEAKRVHLR